MTDTIIPEKPAGLSRRTAIATAAWSVPAVTVAFATPAAAVSAPPVTALTLAFTKEVYRAVPGQAFDGPEAVILRLLDVGNVPVGGAIIQLTIEAPSGNDDGQTNPDESTPSIPPTAYFLDGGVQKTTISLTTDDGGWLRPIVVAGPIGGSLRINAVVISVPGTTSKGQLAQAWLRISDLRDIWSWGTGTYGVLGTGSTRASLIPVAVSLPSSVNSIKGIFGSENHRVFAIDDQDRVWAWGSDANSNLTGGGQALTPRDITSRFPAGLAVTQISLGYDRSYALMSDGSVYGWGASGNQGLFQATSKTNVAANQSTPVRLNFENNPQKLTARIVKVTATRQSAYVLLENGEVWTWGIQTGGALGNGVVSGAVQSGASPVRGLPTDSPVIDVDGHYYGATAVTADGRVYSWGSNSYGEVGDGTTTNRSTAVQILAGRGKALRVYGAYSNAGVVMEDGSAWVWGRNQYGANGNGLNSTSAGAPLQHSFGAAVTALSVGASTMVALLADGTMMGWGRNAAGQTGTGVSGNPVLRPAKVVGLPGPVSHVAATGYSVMVTVPQST
ncbi:RCC1 domain-containing protein [Leifsonia sp. McL0607]|uniref:RCC1 domain-containing protein n=1 Tax=Leifsonia sp. McL0607 TaxID=3415672 RepID=UPI003CFABAA4